MENEKYLLEELKQSDQKLINLNGTSLSLIKFYFTTMFSLGTVVVALYNYNILKEKNILIPYFLLLPLLFFGLVVYNSLKKILIEYEYYEHARNKVSELFVYGVSKHDYKLFGSPLKPFYTLISWIIVGNIFAFIYTALPFLREKSIKTFLLIAIPILLTLIMSAIVLVSLNTARKKARDARRISDLRQVALALEMYCNDNGKYPIANNFDELFNHISPEYMNIMPTDPLNKNEFYYQYESEDGKNYTMKYFLEDGGEKIIKSNE